MSVLFVDDEPMILAALQRLFRPLANIWELHFANSGAEALSTLATSPVDVLVTDLSMPGMNGRELMNQVRNAHPTVVRIVHSGQSDDDAILGCIGLAHQYLRKPCDPDTLLATVSRAFALRHLLNNDALVGLVTQITSLPSVPKLYLNLQDELRKPEPSIKQAAAIVAQDPAMVAKVLQLVNSAFFGLPVRVASAQLATSLLGMETIRALVLALHVFSDRSTRLPAQLSLERLWVHSLRSSEGARIIARLEGVPQEMQDAAMTAGLLHDIGKLILARGLPERYAKMVANEEWPDSVRERAEFGVSHAELGAYLLGIWGLPMSVVNGVAAHNGDMGDDTFLSLAVHVAAQTDSGCAAALDHSRIVKSGFGQRLPVWQDALARIGMPS